MTHNDSHDSHKYPGEERRVIGKDYRFNFWLGGSPDPLAGKNAEYRS